MQIETPDWVKNAIFYQIFPDRFANSQQNPHWKGLRIMPWGSPPEKEGFQGGDLFGIVEKLDHLESLGINAIYLTPIFASACNHRYHTYDYFQVDPLLGGNEALRTLLLHAHARGIRIVLDGVFNHTGRGFWQFHHILENGGNSPYIDWFHIYDWPLRPYATKDQDPNYACWHNLPALPKLNTNTPAVREFIFEVARYWIEFGVDGWRLDVPREIDDDDFWRTFRQVVKSANSEAYLCGEIWTEAKRWLQGDIFDGVMNYLFTGPAISFFAAKTYRNDYIHPHLPFEPFNAEQLASSIERMHGYYDWEITLSQMNMLDSHDMARALWIVQDKTAMKLCVLFQMTMPGAPCIYYGDEIGMSSGGDPDCRAAFPWDLESSWDDDLLEHYKRAISLRTGHPVLRTGTFQIIFAKGKVFAYHRKLEQSEAIIIFNVDTKERSESIALDSLIPDPFFQVWPLENKNGDGEHFIDKGTICVTIPAREGVVLVREAKTSSSHS